MPGVYCCSSPWPAYWTDNGLSVQFPSGWCVSQSCQWQLYIHHAFPVCLCSSSTAPQECSAVPDLFPICLMKWLLVSSGQAWPCNQPSSLLPLFHSTSPVWSHFRGTAPTLLGVIWSFLAWGTDFSWLSQNGLAAILSQVIYLCNCVLSFSFCVVSLLHHLSVNWTNIFAVVIIVTVFIIFNGWLR